MASGAVGLDSEAVLARFEAERRVLARMGHPSIAQVYDAGLDEDGHLEFVFIRRVWRCRGGCRTQVDNTPVPDLRHPNQIAARFCVTLLLPRSHKKRDST